VLPGLIDAHTHLTFNPRFGYDTLAISVPREALIGAKNARVTLLAGFTSVRNVGANAFSDVALRDAINAGDVPGPRIDASGPALGITGGHCDNNLLPYEYHATEIGVADGVENVQHKVREVIKYGADVIKVCATGGVLSLGDDPQHSQYTQAELAAIVADAHRLGRKVAAHAHGAEGIRWAAEAGIDSIEHGSYIDDAAIAAMKQHGTYLVPTLYLGDWFLENAPKTGVPPQMLAKAQAVLPAARKNIAHAFASGVKVGFGTDAAVYPHGLNAREFAVMVKLGLTPLQSIQAATVNDADLLGWSDKVGVIEPNHYADIIAVDGDPLQDVTTLERVKFVMKGGVVYKNEP
jgi:imidazolonepropionase-like amidohydrolase